MCCMQNEKATQMTACYTFKKLHISNGLKDITETTTCSVREIQWHLYIGGHKVFPCLNFAACTGSFWDPKSVNYWQKRDRTELIKGCPDVVWPLCSFLKGWGKGLYWCSAATSHSKGFSPDQKANRNSMHMLKTNAHAQSQTYSIRTDWLTRAWEWLATICHIRATRLYRCTVCPKLR